MVITFAGSYASTATCGSWIVAPSGIHSINAGLTWLSQIPVGRQQQSGRRRNRVSSGGGVEREAEVKGEVLRRRRRWGWK